MRLLAPDPTLAPFVRDFMIVDVQAETTRVRLPEPGLVLGVRYRGRATFLDGAASVPVRLPDVSLTAVSARARRMCTSAGGGVILARFWPGGAAQFFAQPLHELHGATLALAELLPPAEVAEMQERIAGAPGDRARVAAFAAFLRQRLRPEPPDPIVTAALRAIAEARGALKIGTLARRLGISQDPLEKRFRRAVGASPKQLASLVRLRQAIASYRPGLPLGRLAVEAGYFDQSHFTRELRAATGQPPARFLRAGLHH